MLFKTFSFCDVGEPWQMNVQDPATPVAEGMLFFHNYLMFFLIAIVVSVLWLLYSAFHQKVVTVSKFSHSSLLEIIWTILPAVLLVFIAVPSFTLLYSLDELSEPSVTIKIVGHQWYWSYEYSDYLTKTDTLLNLNFDSYMLSAEDLTFGAFRLLEVDNRIVLPINTHIRFLITSSDVLHSWCVPSFGIKIDACPGRLSQGSIFIKREGVYYGQCSEICGVNHGFTPIVIKAVLPINFIKWLLLKLD
jgi:cytochrome c oxidase subunit 2